MTVPVDRTSQFSAELIETEHRHRTLTAFARHTLPKLISGELWVKDAERFLEE